MLNKYSEAIRGNLTKITRLKIVALVTIEIHARDVLEKLYKSGLTDISSFDWLSQLRFYWEKVRGARCFRSAHGPRRAGTPALRPASVPSAGSTPLPPEPGRTIATVGAQWGPRSTGILRGCGRPLPWVGAFVRREAPTPVFHLGRKPFPPNSEPRP